MFGWPVCESQYYVSLSTPPGGSKCVGGGCGRFADTYNCIKTAFHDTDILADILAIEDVGEDVGVVKSALYATVCVGETSDIVGVTSVGETSCRRNVRTPAWVR